MKLWQLKQRQNLSLEAKERLSEHRIREWYDYWEGEVYVEVRELFFDFAVAVLNDLIIKLYPNIKYKRDTNKKPFIGKVVYDSEKDTQEYLKRGCNDVTGETPRSNPIGFWLPKDIEEYIIKYKLCLI